MNPDVRSNAYLEMLLSKYDEPHTFFCRSCGAMHVPNLMGWELGQPCRYCAASSWFYLGTHNKRDLIDRRLRVFRLFRGWAYAHGYQ